ncbi:12872_t:CDS:2 [Cetraspora pellucida]|uniref:12872_t:CDS:1 n=1 Tax=Cetraspora pellucida TaxID=1433469 RepID=A0A9N9DPS5_9GLOM|nr:12872_t:CDS:2 [Cetraspora pellucida]
MKEEATYRQEYKKKKEEIVKEVRRKKPHWLKEEIKMKQETRTSGRQCRPNTPERKKRTRHSAKGRAQTLNNTRSCVKEEKNRLVNKKTNASKWYLKLAKSDDSPGQCYEKAMDTIRNKKDERIGVENDEPIGVEEDERIGDERIDKDERIGTGRDEKPAWE